MSKIVWDTNGGSKVGPWTLPHNPQPAALACSHGQALPIVGAEMSAVPMTCPRGHTGPSAPSLVSMGSAGTPESSDLCDASPLILPLVLGPALACLHPPKPFTHGRMLQVSP